MVKQAMHGYIVLATAVFAVAAIQPLTLLAQPEWDEGDAAEFYIRSHDPANYPEDSWELLDSDGNGDVDYVLLENGDGAYIQEAYDYSGDGRLDDFYFYNEGELVTREIDSNNDGQIDIWVRLVEGYLVAEVQRDTTGDGVADYVRTYDAE